MTPPKESMMTKRIALGRRFLNLQLGLMLFGLGLSLMVQSNLGTDPWTVFHMGASKHLGIPLGTLIQLTGALFLVVSWAFLRQPIGIGSLCNMFFVGPWLEFFMPLTPNAYFWPWALLQVFSGIAVLGFATALYIAADFGAGPRDGFVLGMAFTRKMSIKRVRMGLEFLALAIGYVLGGPVGVGTLLFAVLIGPTMQFFYMRLNAQRTSQD